jgi:hypothetical protein
MDEVVEVALHPKVEKMGKHKKGVDPHPDPLPTS